MNGGQGGTSPLSGYLPGFDGLRAGAVAMVMVSHMGFERIVPGGLGVTVFFAISGFLITNLLLEEYQRSGTVDLKLFYVRRFLRLLPELLAFIGVALLAGLLLGWHATAAEKLAGLFYYFNYYYAFGERQLLAVSFPWRHLWSLSVEEHFYLFFPALLLIVAASWRRVTVTIAALILLPLVWRTVSWFVIGAPWEYNYVATEARIDSIAWGCLLAVVLRGRLKTGRPIHLARFIHPAWLLLGIAAILATLLIRSEDFRWTLRFTIQGAALFLIIANLLFDPRWRPVVAILEWQPVRYIGRISYGLYLYHLLVIRLVGTVLPETSALFAPIALAGSFGMAALSYRLIDDPLKPVRRRYGSKVGHGAKPADVPGAMLPDLPEIAPARSNI